MGILLRDAMKIPPFSKAKLIAGHDGLSREVLSANIQEVPDVDRWLTGGEILFTAGYAFRSGEMGCQLMEKLSKLGVAGLAIKPGQYLKDIPQEMIDCANRYGLPLFELPQDLPYMDCIIAIFERITQEQLTVMRRTERLHNMLTETILNKKGLEGICSILHRVTDSPVFITAPSGLLYAHRIPDMEERAAESYLIGMKKLLEACLCLPGLCRLQENRCNIVSPATDVKLVIVPIYVQDEHLGHLVLDVAANEMMDIDMIAFEQASSMVAVELLNEQALWQREQKVREQLLEDLLMKRYNDEKLVIQRGRYLGFDLTGRYCLFIIDADAFEQTLTNGFLDLREDKIQKIKAQVQQKIRSGMEAFHRPSLILDSSMGAVGIFEVLEENDIARCAEMIDHIIQELGGLHSFLTFSAGIGRAKQGIGNVELGHREALMAMRAGRSMHRPGDKNHTYSFENLGCMCFLSELSDSQAMRDFYEENIRALLNYDINNGTELLKTLAGYFKCRQNLRKTSEMLFVHKNSVVYRLNKIETLLGKKLDDDQAVFDLQLCLKLHALL